MNGRAIIQKLFTRSAIVGAALAVFVGLLLWGTPLGEPWENASYDLLFSCGARAATTDNVVTNDVEFILVEREAENKDTGTRANE